MIAILRMSLRTMVDSGKAATITAIEAAHTGPHRDATNGSAHTRSERATNGSAHMRSERATNGSALGVIVALGMTIVTGCASAKPSACGVVDARLPRSPSAPPGVSTQAKGGHGGEPLPYSGSRD